MTRLIKKMKCGLPHNNGDKMRSKDIQQWTTSRGDGNSPTTKPPKPTKKYGKPHRKKVRFVSG